MGNGPIGIFDSGVGGLTVLKAIRDALPSEDIVYFGDTARVPYGTKSPRTIIKYSLNNVEFLSTFGVKLIVIACNTSSSYALTTLRERYPSLPIVGVVEPGSKLAVSITKNKRIGVIGTPATVKSMSYVKAIKSFLSDALVFQNACPLLVPLIEEGWLDDSVTYEVARRYLEPLIDKGIDTLVLGCTHYPLIKPLLSRICRRINLVDSAHAVAMDVKRLVKPSTNGKGRLRIFVSDKSERFQRIVGMILGEDVPIEEVQVEAENVT